MKKNLIVLLALLTMFTISGCTNAPVGQNNTSQSTIKQEAKQGDTQQSASQSEQAIVCEMAGLGDSQTAWAKEFGEPTAQGDTIRNYKNGAYKTYFEDGKSINITFTSKDGKNPVPAKMLPKDGRKISESSKKTGNATMIVQKWHSDLLASALPATKGNYTIMEHHEGSAYTTVIVDCTPNLHK